MQQLVDKHRFVSSYKGVITENMTDANFNKFIGFLVEHSFKGVRLNNETKKKTKNVGMDTIEYARTTEEYNPSNVINLIDANFNQKTELERFKTLTEKFGLKEVITEWFDFLPTFKKIHRLLETISTEELQELFSDLEAVETGEIDEEDL